MQRHAKDATMWAVTLPGFGGTPPLSAPQDERFTGTPWTRSAIKGIEKLLADEKIDRVTIVAHWALASQIALQLALDHPGQVEAVILVAGNLKSYYSMSPEMMTWTAAQRSAFVEGMGQRWFKTVTRHTWDDNNYMSYDYAVNPLRGLFLWREAQAPSLTVWIRYLLEWYAFDQTPQLANLKVPTLVVQPGFDDPGFFVDAGNDYMRDNCVASWKGAGEASSLLTFETIPHSRLFVMFDQPEALDEVIERFLAAQAVRKASGAS